MNTSSLRGESPLILSWLPGGFAVGFVVPYTLVLDHRVKTRVTELDFSQPTRVYARPQLLQAGVPMNKATLELELRIAGYSEAAHVAQVPGTYSVEGGTFTIASRGYADPMGGEAPRRVRVRVSNPEDCLSRLFSYDLALPCPAPPGPSQAGPREAFSLASSVFVCL